MFASMVSASPLNTSTRINLSIYSKYLLVFPPQAILTSLHDSLLEVYGRNTHSS